MISTGILAVGMDSGTSGATFLHPVGLASLLSAGIATLILPRRHVLVPILAIATFMPDGQRLVLGGMDFPLTRLMVLFGWLRLLTRRERPLGGVHVVDIFVLAWCVVSTIAYVVLMGASSAPFKLGTSFDALGLYLLFRVFVGTWEDIRRISVSFVVLAVISAVLFLVEYLTSRNPFATLGGVPELVMTRDGRQRCQGPFPHPIIAGCYWALLIPLFASLWWHKSHWRLAAYIGVVAASVIVLTSGSSTPVLSVFAAVLGFMFFPLRQNMRQIRWGMVISLVALHLVMNGPVWSLLGKVDITGGSTGYHRVLTIDETIKHVDEWWLVGIRSVTHWSPLLYDITNHFVLEGLRGGLATMALFVAILATAFSAAGRICEKVAQNTVWCITAWALATSLFVHTVTFFGVTYFGSITVIWYLHLAMVASLDANSRLAEHQYPLRRRMARPVSVRVRVARLGHLGGSHSPIETH